MALERELFVYWKVASADAPRACAAAALWLDELRAAQPGLVTGLYRRPGASPAGEVTVMETYALPGRGLDEALLARITAGGDARLRSWAPGGRHVEVFERWPG